MLRAAAAWLRMDPDAIRKRAGGLEVLPPSYSRIQQRRPWDMPAAQVSVAGDGDTGLMRVVWGREVASQNRRVTPSRPTRVGVTTTQSRT